MAIEKLDKSELYGFPVTDLETATAEETAGGITLPVIVVSNGVLTYKVVATKTWSDYVATVTTSAIAGYNQQVSTAVSAANTARDNAQKAADAANGKIASLDAAVTKANELTDNVSSMEARVSNVGTVIDNANEATTAAITAAQSVNDAKSQATAAAKSANDAAKNANDAAKTATDAAGKADQATANAKDATSLAQTATTSANNASADAQAAEVQRAAAEAQRAAAYQKMTEGNAATISEMQRVVANITNAQSAAPMTSVPASIYTATELTAAVGETVSVAPSVFVPASCNRSVLYRVISDTGKVRYNGDVILPSDAADVVVEVIPALNNMAARVVTIHAVAPTPILDLAGEEITDEKGEAITA